MAHEMTENDVTLFWNHEQEHQNGKKAKGHNAIILNRSQTTHNKISDLFSKAISVIHSVEHSASQNFRTYARIAYIYNKVHYCKIQVRSKKGWPTWNLQLYGWHMWLSEPAVYQSGMENCIRRSPTWAWTPQNFEHQKLRFVEPVWSITFRA